MGRKPSLTAVSNVAATVPEPPPELGASGRALWDTVMREYDIQDAGGRELLRQAALASDRADALAARINQDGEVLATKFGLKAHPALKDEINCRAFLVRTLNLLGLNLEPTKPHGRPAGSVVTWRGD